MERRQRILALAQAIEATFCSSEWTKVGYLTATDQWIDRHPPLLRSLHSNDPAYKGHVIDAVAHVLDKVAANLKRLVDYEPIATWLRAHDPGVYQALLAEAHGLEVPEVVPASGSAGALAALAYAQALLETRGPTSAVERLHTGPHGFLKAVCQDAKIAFDSDATPNQLLKALLDHDPALALANSRERMAHEPATMISRPVCRTTACSRRLRPLLMPSVRHCGTTYDPLFP
jgi:AbiJ N-terminal domain 5